MVMVLIIVIYCQSESKMTLIKMQSTVELIRIGLALRVNIFVL